MKLSVSIVHIPGNTIVLYYVAIFVELSIAVYTLYFKLPFHDSYYGSLLPFIVFGICSPLASLIKFCCSTPTLHFAFSPSTNVTDVFICVKFLFSSSFSPLFASSNLSFDDSPNNLKKPILFEYLENISLSLR